MRTYCMGVKRPGRPVLWLAHEGLACLGIPATYDALWARDLYVDDEHDAKTIMTFWETFKDRPGRRIHMRIFEDRRI